MDTRNNKRIKQSMDSSKFKKPLVPVSLISGFLGSGKTTLLKHILTNKSGLKVAVIVNDISTLNIDASLIEMSGLIQTKEEIIHMQNGCICCTLRGDLIREITKISEQQKFDYIVIESTGVGEPIEVVESFLFDVETLNLPEVNDFKARPLSTIARMDTCITVVDAFELPYYLSSIESIGQKFTEEEPPNAEKPISQLLINQIEFANVIILNKIDLISHSKKIECKAIIKALNPCAKVVETTNAVIDIKEVLNTGLFSIEEIQSSPLWIKQLSKEHVPETEEYGISSFIYKARKPFNPSKFHEWITNYFVMNDSISPENNKNIKNPTKFQMLANDRKFISSKAFGNIFRSKGFVWLPTRNDIMIELELSGCILSLKPLENWYDTVDETEWGLSETETLLVKNNFEGIHGDRRQEIVFIGVGLNEAAITNSLNDCLLNDEMFHSNEHNSWLKLIDPFPIWEVLISPEFWASIVSENKSELLHIPDGCTLAINKITLEQSVLDCNTSTVVRVWMDFVESKSSVLLAVLRNTAKENITLNTIIPENTTIKLRVEEFPKNKNVTFVHLIGYCSKSSTECDDVAEETCGLKEENHKH